MKIGTEKYSVPFLWVQKTILYHWGYPNITKIGTEKYSVPSILVQKNIQYHLYWYRKLFCTTVDIPTLSRFAQKTILYQFYWYRKIFCTIYIGTENYYVPSMGTEKKTSTTVESHKPSEMVQKNIL